MSSAETKTTITVDEFIEKINEAINNKKDVFELGVDYYTIIADKLRDVYNKFKVDYTGYTDINKRNLIDDITDALNRRKEILTIRTRKDRQGIIISRTLSTNKDDIIRANQAIYPDIFRAYQFYLSWLQSTPEYKQQMLLKSINERQQKIDELQKRKEEEEKRKEEEEKRKEEEAKRKEEREKKLEIELEKEKIDNLISNSLLFKSSTDMYSYSYYSVGDLNGIITRYTPKNNKVNSYKSDILNDIQLLLEIYKLISKIKLYEELNEKLTPEEPYVFTENNFNIKNGLKSIEERFRSYDKLNQWEIDKALEILYEEIFSELYKTDNKIIDSYKTQKILDQYLLLKEIIVHFNSLSITFKNQIFIEKFGNLKEDIIKKNFEFFMMYFLKYYGLDFTSASIEIDEEILSKLNDDFFKELAFFKNYFLKKSLQDETNIDNFINAISNYIKDVALQIYKSDPDNIVRFLKIIENFTMILGLSSILKYDIRRIYLKYDELYVNDNENYYLLMYYITKLFIKILNKIIERKPDFKYDHYNVSSNTIDFSIDSSKIDDLKEFISKLKSIHAIDDIEEIKETDVDKIIKDIITNLENPALHTVAKIAYDTNSGSFTDNQKEELIQAFAKKGIIIESKEGGKKINKKKKILKKYLKK